MFKGFKTKDVNTAKQSAKYNPFVKFFFCHRYNIPDSAYFDLATAVYKSKQTGLPQTVKIGERSVVIENGALSSKTKITEQSEIAGRVKSFAKGGATIGAAFGATLGVASLIMTAWTFYELASAFSKNVIISVAPSMVAGLVVISTAAGAAVGAAVGVGAAAVSRIIKTIRNQKEVIPHSDEDWYLF
jgi:hypothetical protein